MCLGGEWAKVIATKDFNDSLLKPLYVHICKLTVNVKGAI